MKTELTLNVLQTMNAQEYEDIRAAGSDERRADTHRDAGTGCAGQLDDERRKVRAASLAAFFPVRVCFTPAHERFPPGVMFTRAMSLWVWVLVLVNAGGEPFAVVQVQRRFAPEAVSHSLALAGVTGCAGYSVNDIIHILMAEGDQV